MSSQAYSGDALRRGSWHYLSGRAVTAVLTIAIQLVLVRLLALEAYGQYVALLASVDLAIVVAALGLNWSAVRYVPEYRIKASHEVAWRFITRLITWRIAGLLCAVALWLVVSTWLFHDVGGANPWIVRALLTALIVVEGLSLFIRDNLLSALLQQKAVRTANILRQGTWLALLIAIWAFGHTGLVEVLMADLVASGLGLMVGWRGLHRGMKRSMADARDADGWVEPSLGDLWRTSSRFYASDMLGMISSPSMLAILTGRIAGDAAAAVFGFLRVMYNQVHRFLPAMLLFRLIQPKLTASYVEGGGMPALARNANLVNKASLLTLMPILIVTALLGEELLALLSGGRFTDTGWLMAVAQLHLVPASQGMLLLTVAVVAGRPGFSTLAMAASLAVIPLAWLGLQQGWGVWAAVLAQLAHEAVVVAALLALLTRHAGYSVRGSGLWIIPTLTLVSLAPALAVAVAEPSLSTFHHALLAAGSVALYALLIWKLRVVDTDDRRAINQLAGRTVFSV